MMEHCSPPGNETAMRRALAAPGTQGASITTRRPSCCRPRPPTCTAVTYASRAPHAGLEAAGRPGIITYSRKVFIPLTRLSVTGAPLHVRDRPRPPEAAFLTPTRSSHIARRRGTRLQGGAVHAGDHRRRAGPRAREWLDAHGYDDTLSYVRAMAIRVLEETGCCRTEPRRHVLADFQRLKPVAPSMGMMLETTAARLFTDKGGPHFGSPDKDRGQAARAGDAGRSGCRSTTGI